MKFLKNYFSFLKKKKKRIYLIYEDEKDFLIKSLFKEKIIAIDTEFDWRNTYFPKLSLIQISTKDTVFLVDCLNLTKATELKNLLENLDLLIFHSVRSDATVLFSALDIKVKNVFDVQIAEKFLSKNSNKNYGEIVKKYISLNLKKTETNSNWLKRPLTEMQIDYASDDVEYLIEIYQLQRKKLKSNFDEVLRVSNEEASLGNQELFVSRLAKINHLSDLEKRIFMWRENLAIKKDVPPSYVFKSKQLKKIFNILKNDMDIKSLEAILKDSSLAKDLYEELG